ncbi:MAG: PEP-CTERM sorting domain-containing protein [Phycisphaerales bacterium]|jgi:hypothetical protein|nr:PEP-CTERM sorting domain-containing protein [Phycisphaerales bacterium]
MKKATTILLSLSVFAVCLALAAPAHADIILLADFDSSPLRNAGATISAGDLNAGTTGGTWTVNNDEESLIAVESTTASNHALAADRGPYDFAVAITATAPTLATDQVIVSFDSQIVRTVGTANQKKNRVIGWDSLSNKVFEIVLTTDGSNPPLQGRLKYVNQSGTEVILANDLPSVGGNPVTFTDSNLTGLRIEMSAATMDIYVGAAVTPTADDVAYRTAGVTDLASISFVGVGTSDSNSSGAWYDNIEVSGVPEPATIFIMLTAGLPALLKRKRKSR